MAYVPLFTETQTTFPPSLRLGTEFETLNSKVPSRINREYTDATQQAYNIGNIAATTGITNPQSLVNLSQHPQAVNRLRGMDLVDRTGSKTGFEKQGLSSDYRHALGTSAFKDSIIDWAASNLGMNKRSGILNALGSGVAKGATIFEEGKDAWRALDTYNKKYPYSGIQDYDELPEESTLSFKEILAQPIEDFTANWFAADQIPFGTSPVKKMEMINAYRKYGKNLYRQHLMNRRKQDMQQKIRQGEAKEELAAKKPVTTFHPSQGNVGPDTPSGLGKGQSPTGGDVAGTPFVRGGRASYFDGGLLSLWPR